jgi:hypothetical protein
LALKRIKELERREDQNILELKMDKMLTDSTAVMESLEMDKFAADTAEGVILLEALNSLSFRFFSFTDPTLLSSFSRSVEVSQGNS